ncbi:hypothetical protein IGI04_014957 [Brassica rapa subsp. trilocularis]|uniref:Uncharacterized protein n=1 Tax=Brassica rapa subsp. trilocularis TaxID=1813537 RepID=A0ABQ7MNR2_BRACM|nr:hypothetical protein IGI04_014957 [Brassica rapa subsp. trilocularis]
MARAHHDHRTPRLRQGCHHRLPQLRIAGNRHLLSFVFPPSCSFRRDEAIATDHDAIRVRLKSLEPPEVSPLRARELHAPPPEIVAAVFATVLHCRTTTGTLPYHCPNFAGPPLLAVTRRYSPSPAALTRR